MTQKYSLTLPDLTKEEAIMIAESHYGSMIWQWNKPQSSLLAWPGPDRPAIITEQRSPKPLTDDIEVCATTSGNVDFNFPEQYFRARVNVPIALRVSELLTQAIRVAKEYH